MRTYLKEWRKDYRHVICFVTTLIFLGLGFLFPNALPRVAETVRDFCISIAYYFCELFAPESNPIKATVLEAQSWKFGEQIWKPLELFPYSWEEFTVLWTRYWSAVFSSENFTAYCDKIGDILYNLSRISMIILPFSLCVIMYFDGYKKKRCTERNKKSRPLKTYEGFTFRVIYPITAWVKDFIAFNKENDIYYKTWLLLWMLYFNVISIFVAFVAYYLFFAVSFDVLSIYKQLLKLLVDLTPAVRFLPGIVWLGIGVLVYNYICRSMAFARLYYYEKCNRAVLRDRGVLSVIYGPPRIGKTQFVTSMALSAEIEQFDMAFEIMLNKTIMFPNFPWQRFRDEIKKGIKSHTLVDSRSCRKWVLKGRRFFDYISSTYTAEEWKVNRKRFKNLNTDYTFGYDYTHYATTYNDNLKITHLFDVLAEYACAYLKFTVKTTLLFANYSIRTDSILHDLGNMPFRDNDFFNRDPRYQEAYSKHAHIIDFEMIRLGKRILEVNPNSYAAPTGVMVISEIDKERKNALTLRDVKSTSKECNQLNDLTEACIMVIGHADVIDNRHFIRIIADLQRPESWGANGRELGDVIYIAEKDEIVPALPFFSPYWLLQGLFTFVKKWWDNYKEEVEINRSDKTLFYYLCENIISKIDNHYKKVEGLFGYWTVDLEIQSGKLEGEVKKEKWRHITKKDRSRRYRTDCLSSIFDSYVPNRMHIDDFIMYAGEVGTQEENALQNSHFQNDIRKMKGMNL